MRMLVSVVLGFAVLVSSSRADEEVWKGLSEGDRAEVEARAAEFLDFVAKARTERTSVREVVRRAREAGFVPFDPSAPWRAGARVYEVNRGCAVALWVAGRRPLADGMRVAVGHVDSPRLDLKARPVYSSWGFAMLQTIPHGGIKNYQWANVPLALVGTVVKKDGIAVEVEVGLAEGDPVLVIPDLAPHVDKPYRGRTQSNVLEGEEMDPVAASRSPVEKEVWAFLSSRYGIEKDDLVGADLALVPATRPRAVGVDGAMIGAYGQDDRLCSWAAFRALVDLPAGGPERTAMVYLVDNEETGSPGNTGAKSLWFQGLVGRMVAVEAGGAADENRVRACLSASRVLSADTTEGVHPTFSGVQESGNACRLGRGVVLKMYGKGTDASPEFVAWYRGALHEAGVPWQVHTYKVDVGGGGTVGQFFTALDMEVLDVGVGLLSMHSPFELSSKVDLWCLVRSSRAFFEAP